VGGGARDLALTRCGVRIATQYPPQPLPERRGFPAVDGAYSSSPARGRWRPQGVGGGGRRCGFRHERTAARPLRHAAHATSPWRGRIGDLDIDNQLGYTLPPSPAPPITVPGGGSGGDGRASRHASSGRRAGHPGGSPPTCRPPGQRRPAMPVPTAWPSCARPHRDSSRLRPDAVEETGPIPPEATASTPPRCTRHARGAGRAFHCPDFRGEVRLQILHLAILPARSAGRGTAAEGGGGGAGAAHLPLHHPLRGRSPSPCFAWGGCG